MQLVWLEKGQSLFPAVDYNKAREAYTRAIALGHEDARALFNCGTAQDERGDSQQALMDLDKAIELDPEYAHGLIATVVLSMPVLAMHGGQYWTLTGPYN